MRSIAAWSAFAAVFVLWAAFVVYGVYVRARLHRYCAYEWPPKSEQWNPAFYSPGAEPWIRRDRLWTKWRWPVFFGTILLGNGLYIALRP